MVGLKEIKAYFTLDSSGAKKGVAEVDASLSGLEKSATSSATSIGSKVESAFTHHFGKGSIASSSVESLGGTIDSLAAGALGGALPIAAAGAGVAIAKFAIDSANKFGDLSLEVQRFSTVSGLGTQDASRWVAVASEFGVSADTLAGGVGKLGKALGNNVEALKKYGIEAVKAKDGSVDLAATTLRVIDAYNSTTDPAKRAALGAAAFGKGYQELIPLIVKGSDEITTAMGKIPKSEILSESQVQSGIKFKESMVELKKEVEGLELTFGRLAAPVLTELAHNVEGVVGPLNDLANALPSGTLTIATRALTDFLNPWKGIKDAVGLVQDKLDSLSGKVLPSTKANVDDATAAMLLHDRAQRQAATAVDTTVAALDIYTLGMAQAQAITGDATNSMADLVAEQTFAIAKAKDQYAADKQVEDAKKGLVAATDSYVKSLQGEIDASLASGDASIAAQDAQEKLAAATAASAAAQANHKIKAADLQKAIDDERDAIIGASKAQLDLTVKQQAATGATVSATQKVDDFNASLEQNASSATPAARKAAYDYLIQVNQIPPEKATLIQADVDHGLLAKANHDIEAASVTRATSVEVTANTKQAESDIQQLIKTRNMVINAQIIASGGAGYAPTVHAPGAVNRSAAGGPVPANIPRLVGELGPEIFVPNSAGTIIPNDRLGVSSNGTGIWRELPAAAQNHEVNARNVVYNINVDATGATDPAAVGRRTVEQIRAYERINGRGWRN